MGRTRLLRCTSGAMSYVSRCVASWDRRKKWQGQSRARARVNRFLLFSLRLDHRVAFRERKCFFNAVARAKNYSFFHRVLPTLLSWIISGCICFFFLYLDSAKIRSLFNRLDERSRGRGEIGIKVNYIIIIYNDYIIILAVCVSL